MGEIYYLIERRGLLSDEQKRPRNENDWMHIKHHILKGVKIWVSRPQEKTKLNEKKIYIYLACLMFDTHLSSPFSPSVTYLLSIYLSSIWTIYNPIYPTPPLEQDMTQGQF